MGSGSPGRGADLLLQPGPRLRAAGGQPPGQIPRRWGGGGGVAQSGRVHPARTPKPGNPGARDEGGLRPLCGARSCPTPPLRGPFLSPTCPATCAQLGRCAGRGAQPHLGRPSSPRASAALILVWDPVVRPAGPRALAPGAWAPVGSSGQWRRPPGWCPAPQRWSCSSAASTCWTATHSPSPTPAWCCCCRPRASGCR